jgi:hypothetical protein
MPLPRKQTPTSYISVPNMGVKLPQATPKRGGPLGHLLGSDTA